MNEEQAHEAEADRLEMVINDHGTGYQGGYHVHHHSGAPDPRAAVQASIDTTTAGAVLGRPIDQWDPADLGVHDSITVQDETTLTPYIPRAHDTDLWGHLKDLEAPGAGSRLVLVVGTSCTGKTRTLFEAVREILHDWQLVAPGSDSDLARILLDGIPAHTVVWLDELQDQFTKTSHGVTAANAIRLLLESDSVGPILFAGTIWPTNYDALLARPSPEESSAGAGAISKLLKNAVQVEVPERFTDADLATAQNSEDARLRKAFATATETSHPEQGRKITQVLAGGTQLVNRLHPPPGNAPPDKFSPAARAVLKAAGDLRRVGIPNPIPRWALEGAAPAYLDPPTTRPPHTWLPAALTETTHDADADDATTGNQTLDIHARGVPALTPHGTTGPAGQDLEAYDLHDYLYQDHLNRHRFTPTRQQLWDTLTSHHDQLNDPKSIARAALDRGLLTTAITILRALANAGHRLSQGQLIVCLATCGDDAALTELRTLANAGNEDAQRELAEALAIRGDAAALTELRTLAHAGHRLARNRLTHSLAIRGDAAAFAELRSRADAGDFGSLYLLVEALVTRGDAAALAELRTLANAVPAGYWFSHRVTDLLATLGDETALTELRTRADDGDRDAQDQLARILATRGDKTALTELRTLADAGNEGAEFRLAEALAACGDAAALTELRALVLSGSGGHALLWAYRSQSPDRHISELNCDARPVYTDSP